MTLAEYIQEAYVLDTLNDISSPSFKPSEGLPDAETFFNELSAQLPDYLGLAEGDYIYHNVHVYWWIAFGSLYLTIPEYDIYERHDGAKWASHETAMEAAHELQHRLWDDDDMEFLNRDKY